jgi:hypothetical protein
LFSASRACFSGENRGFTASYAQNRPLAEEETADFLGKTGGRRAKQLPRLLGLDQPQTIRLQEDNLSGMNEAELIEEARKRGLPVYNFAEE